MKKEEKKTNQDILLEDALGDRYLEFKRNDKALSALHEENKPGITGIEEVKSSVQKMEDNSKDIRCNLEQMHFLTKTQTVPLSDGSEITYQNLACRLPEDDIEYVFSDWGLGQVANVLKVPISYLRHCIKEGATQLAVQNMDYWKAVHDEATQPRLVRITDNRIRGLLSHRYNCFDDSAFLHLVQDALPVSMPFTVSNYTVSPDVTKIRVVLSEKLHIGDEDLTVGFDISNSRVGRSSIRVQFLIYRWACSNGMVFGGGVTSLFSQTHRKQIINIETMQQIVSDLPNIIDHVEKYVNQSMAKMLNQSMVEYLVADFRNKAVNSEAMTEAIVSLMDEQYGRTQLGFANAASEIAQKYSLFTREKVEQYAGSLVIPA